MSVYSVRATSDEKMRHLPGDDLIAEPLQSLTHAITVRCRSYRLYGLPEWATRWLVPPGHFVMQRKQLLGIDRRAERVAGIRQPSGCLMPPESADRPSGLAADLEGCIQAGCRR